MTLIDQNREGETAFDDFLRWRERGGDNEFETNQVKRHRSGGGCQQLSAESPRNGIEIAASRHTCARYDVRPHHPATPPAAASAAGPAWGGARSGRASRAG